MHCMHCIHGEYATEGHLKNKFMQRTPTHYTLQELKASIRREIDCISEI